MRCKRAWLASAELRTWASIFLPKSTSFRHAPRGVTFDRLRKELDPNGLFENQFVKQLFADSGQKAA